MTLSWLGIDCHHRCHPPPRVDQQIVPPGAVRAIEQLHSAENRQSVPIRHGGNRSRHGHDLPAERTMGAERHRLVCQVSLIDNGPGIPDEIKDKIFQPNFTTKKGGLSFGLGLGLSIVQRLVDSYNGKIEVSSRKGKTSFTVKIPVG